MKNTELGAWLSDVAILLSGNPEAAPELDRLRRVLHNWGAPAAGPVDHAVSVRFEAGAGALKVTAARPWRQSRLVAQIVATQLGCRAGVGWRHGGPEPALTIHGRVEGTAVQVARGLFLWSATCGWAQCGPNPRQGGDEAPPAALDPAPPAQSVAIPALFTGAVSLSPSNPPLSPIAHWYHGMPQRPPSSSGPPPRTR